MINRIVFIGFYIPGNASSNFVVSFCKGYAQLGLDVVLILNVQDEKNIPNIEGVRIIPICNMGRWKRERTILRYIKQYYQEGSTVVQYYSSPTYGWLRPFNRRMEFHTHGEIPFANPNAPFRFKLTEWFVRLSTRTATGLLVQTNQLKDYYTRYGIKNIQVFNIIIDPSRFEGLKKTTTEKYISYCGSIGVYKDGVNDLIDAFAMISTKHPDVKLQLIGGFFSPEDERVLREKVATLNISDKVVFVGRVAPEQMPSLLYNSEILALARPNNKQAQYGFPSKLGEYLFTGNPVVLTRVGEIDHFLKDGESSVFANPDDPKDFAEKLDWVLSHPKEARVIGDAGHKVAEENFSILSQCRVAVDFFQRVLTKLYKRE